MHQGTPTSPGKRRPDGYYERGAQVTRTEAFVDAALAIAVTLLAVSIDAVPQTREELIAALKAVPSFFASFIVLALFWSSHHDWSRRFGLDDGPTTRLSLIFVMLILVFVYPLKIIFAGMFAWLSDGWLPSAYPLVAVEDLVLMYVVYGAGFAALGFVVLGLTIHAWQQREALGLDPLERLLTQREIFGSLMLPGCAALSLVLALQLRPGLPDYAYALPGFVYFAMGLGPLINLYGAARERALRAELGLS